MDHEEEIRLDHLCCQTVVAVMHYYWHAMQLNNPNLYSYPENATEAIGGKTKGFVPGQPQSTLCGHVNGISPSPNPPLVQGGIIPDCLA